MRRGFVALVWSSRYKAQITINKVLNISAMAIQYQVNDSIPKEFNDLKFNKSDSLYFIIELVKNEKGEEFVRHSFI